MSPHCRYVDGDRPRSIHADIDDVCVEEPAQRDDRGAMHRGQSLDLSAMEVTRSCLSRRGGGEGELAGAPVRPHYLPERTLLVRAGGWRDGRPLVESERTVGVEQVPLERGFQAGDLAGRVDSGDRTKRGEQLTNGRAGFGRFDRGRVAQEDISGILRVEQSLSLIHISEPTRLGMI